MISVSSNELGLGFGDIMEESDFEEESTHSYVSCVDPDVALSYIDEKLENVLGHFQKDFEGGISAENLGSKFGGYGSFLAMYQRSPACKTPPQAQNQVVSVSGSTSKAPTPDALVKLKKSVQSTNIGTPDSKQKPLIETSSSPAPSNPKTLRLRIKVGSTDLSSLKNVSNFSSKPDLNIPPSTSRLNCLSEVEQGLLYGIRDSPTKILMAMVSFPLHKDQMLSPLSDDLIELGKKAAEYVYVNKTDSKGKHDGLGVSDVQKCGGKLSAVKKEKLKERVKYLPSSNGLGRNHIVSKTEKEVDKQSCEDLVSETMKLPLLSCLSPSSYIHPRNETKISDSYVEDVKSASRGTNNTDIDAAKMGLQSELEANVVEFPDRSVKETGSVRTRTEGETLHSMGSKTKREKAPKFEHADNSSIDKVSQSKIRNGDSILMSKPPRAQRSQKRSSRNSLRGKDGAVNISNTNLPDKLQGGIRGSESVYEEFFGDSAEEKEGNQSSPVLEAKIEKHPEENSVKESFKSTENNEEACNYPETSKKPKTAKSQYSAVDRPGSNKFPDIVNKTTVTQASVQKVKDVPNASSRDGLDDIKKKQKENGNYMGLGEDTAMESSEEKFRKKKRVRGSSCDGKELPFSSENRDRYSEVSQENGRNSSPPHLPFTVSSPSLSKDLGSRFIKTNVHQAKGSLDESLAPSALRVLDAPELKSGRKSERVDHHDTDSNAVDTLKRGRDGEGYSTIDKPGRTKKAAEIRKDDNLLITGKERADGENCSSQNYKPKKSRRHSSDDCTGGETQRTNREGSSSAPWKENSKGMANEVQDLDTAVESKTKESRSMKRPSRKVSTESHKEDLRDINGSHVSSPQRSDRAKRKSNQLEVNAEKLKNKSTPPADTEKFEVLGHSSDITHTKKPRTRNDNHNVTSQNHKQNGSTHKDHVSPSPMKKEPTSQAVSVSNSIKEATDLKHMADRLKNVVSSHESTGVYFQAALKFLHGASLLESAGTENKGIARALPIYGSTAKLCEYCAHEYEKSKDMGAAALAYKCMEVAYLRITYSSNGNISRYRNDLQAALQVTPSGESPSFASDGENPNPTLALKEVTLSNTVRSSPSITGNHVISAGNKSSLSQLLAFSKHASFAMDASRKSQIAFAAAKGNSFDTRYSSDGITSIKRALDFSFQDMDKLLHVVRLAMESINR